MAQGNPSEDRATRLAQRCVDILTCLPRSRFLSLNFQLVLYGNDTVFTVLFTLTFKVFPCFLKILEQDIRCRCPSVIVHDICNR